jgi:FkbM family methyltransferase
MSSYTNSVAKNTVQIPENGLIVECGSRDCLDAIEVLNCYNPRKIYSFECNPESIQVCKHNIANYDNIELVESAVGNCDDVIDFYATDMEKSKDKNIGASSALFHNRGQKDFIQKKISVPCTRLDTFMNNNNIENIDLLCLDLQGYEKVALEGMGERIKDVSYIITEVNFESYYEDSVLFDDLLVFLNEKGFLFQVGWPAIHFFNRVSFGDAIFKRAK